jgi:hypothetical protein
MMRCVALLTILIGLTACGRPDIGTLRVNELGEARSAFLSNIAAIQARDTEAYLSHYLQSPDFLQASGDTVQRSFLTFAAERRANQSWPDTLVAGDPIMVWLAPSVVYGVYPYQVTQEGEISSGWSERVLIKTGGGWKIAVTSVMPRVAPD